MPFVIKIFNVANGSTPRFPQAASAMLFRFSPFALFWPLAAGKPPSFRTSKLLEVTRLRDSKVLKIIVDAIPEKMLIIREQFRDADWCLLIRRFQHCEIPHLNAPDT
jgi:hypothetical protein